jgi:hypothetical protein
MGPAQSPHQGSAQCRRQVSRDDDERRAREAVAMSRGFATAMSFHRAAKLADSWQRLLGGRTGHGNAGDLVRQSRRLPGLLPRWDVPMFLQVRYGLTRVECQLQHGPTRPPPLGLDRFDPGSLAGDNVQRFRFVLRSFPLWRLRSCFSTPPQRIGRVCYID